MVGESSSGFGDRFFGELNTRIRDIEEKERLIKDRILLVSESFVKERDKNFNEIKELKKTVFQLKEDNRRIKEMLLRIGEAIEKMARKEELIILQKQFNLFRDD